MIVHAAQAFMVPDNSQLLAGAVSRIVGAKFVNGNITVPPLLEEQGRSVAYTGYLVGRFHSIRSTFETRTHDLNDEAPARRAQILRERHAAGYMGILKDRKLPSFLRFDEAGFEDCPVPCAQVIELAAEYLSMGYRGQMWFDFGHVREDEWESRGHVELVQGGRALPSPNVFRLEARDDATVAALAPFIEYCCTHFAAP